ncbi:MAG: hypothetical protein H6925_03955 [Holosporaceae bacterium]|nr:MAG: hypothetical protein H6925_03955 [Holosporaceae bacterium]
MKKLEQQKQHMQKFVDRFRAKATKAAQAQSRIKQIQKIDAVLENIPVTDEARTFSLPKLNYPKSGKEVLVTENLAVGYDVLLIQNIHLRLNRADKIGIVGRMGLGNQPCLKV